MGVDFHTVAHFAAEQAPGGDAERLAQDVPKRKLDARDRGHANHAQPPEHLLLHDPDELLDVAGITPEEERCEILDGAGHSGRLPFEGRFAPAVETRLIRLDAHEDPVAHLGIHDTSGHRGDLHAAAPHFAYYNLMIGITLYGSCERIGP